MVHISDAPEPRPKTAERQQQRELAAYTDVVGAKYLALHMFPEFVVHGRFAKNRPSLATLFCCAGSQFHYSDANWTVMLKLMAKKWRAVQEQAPSPLQTELQEADEREGEDAVISVLDAALKASLGTSLMSPTQTLSQDDASLLGTYLHETALPHLVDHLLATDPVMYTASLSETFHAFGVNMRYLGHVLGLLQSERDGTAVPIACEVVEREILVRSAVYAIRAVLCCASPGEVAGAAATLLNELFFGTTTGLDDSSDGPVSGPNRPSFAVRDKICP